MGVLFREALSASAVRGGEAGLAPGASAKAQLIAETREFWQHRTRRTLTGEDAREIAENVTGFFDLLHKWDRESSTKASK